jgi:heavy metal sensor kinase
MFDAYVAFVRRLSALAARLPTRVRVALAFSFVMAVLLAGVGLFLYIRLGTTLDGAIDRGLRSRAGDVVAMVQHQDAGLAQAGRNTLTERGENLAQIIDARGRVVDSAPSLRKTPLLTPAEQRRALRHTIVVEHAASTREPDQFRLLATPVAAQGRRVIVVVGATSETRDEAQAQLGNLLLLGGPIALLLASLAGYGAAAGALRPVELMRRRAQDIQASRPGRRLPVPPSKDEIARLGETLNDMLARLEEAFAHERRFVADASHELRTPLAILRGELELAHRDARDVETFRSAVTSAVVEVDRLTQLAEDLLVAARSDQGRLPTRLERLDLGDELQRVAGPFARRAADRGAMLTLDVQADARLTADRQRLTQAVGNMIDNALRHGGPNVRVEAHSRNGHTEIHVRDDGPGFPAELLPGAFDRFTRADPARTAGGAGLGLAIVQSIARAHGGRALATNQDGGGADVWLELPTDRDPQDEP